MTGGYSFWVIPASHHPRVVCLSACASGYTCENVHARGRQPPLPSHVLRFPISSTTSLCDWQAKAILSPISLLGIIVGAITSLSGVLHAGKPPSILFASGSWRHCSRKSVLLSNVAAIWNRVDVLQPLYKEHLSLTMASSLIEEASTRPVSERRLSTALCCLRTTHCGTEWMIDSPKFSTTWSSRWLLDGDVI